MSLIRSMIFDPPNRGRGPSGPTYAQFQAHIATLATEGVAVSNANQPAGAYRVVPLNNGQGAMFGSSWASVFPRDGAGSAAANRVIQHGLPSEVVYLAQTAASRELFFRRVDSGTSSFVSLDRNGYVSSADAGGPFSASQCTDLIYWDGTGAQRMNPSTGTGPTPYSF